MLAMGANEGILVNIFLAIRTLTPIHCSIIRGKQINDNPSNKAKKESKKKSFFFSPLTSPYSLPDQGTNYGIYN
jgi:hypothetical protein